MPISNTKMEIAEQHSEIALDDYESVYDSSFNQELNKIPLQQLVHPLKVENLLDELITYKIKGAVAGAFSLTALGLGVLLNTIPRAMRASEANNLKKLFTSARLFVTDKHTKHDEERLEKFHQLINSRAAIDHKNAIRALNSASPKGSERLHTVVKNAEKVLTLSLKNIATMLTLANYYTAKDLNKETICSPQAVDVLPYFCRGSDSLPRFSHSMVAGLFSSHNISYLSTFVARMFVSLNFTSGQTEIITNIKASIKGQENKSNPIHAKIDSIKTKLNR